MSTHTNRAVAGFLAGLAALAFSLPAQATCTVATDEVGDAQSTNWDINSIRMNAIADTLTASMLMSSSDQPNVMTEFFVHFVDQNGQGWFVGTTVVAGPDNFTYYRMQGTYDPSTGAYDRNIMAEDTGVTVDAGGGLYTFSAPLGLFGNPTQLTGVGATVSIGTDTLVEVGATTRVDDTANDGTFDVGANSCGEAKEGDTPSVKAERCEVVTDAANDMAPQFDILSARMFQNGSSIGAEIEIFDLNAPTVDTNYVVHWVDEGGAGYYIGGAILADAAQGAVGVTTADVGTYDPSTGTYGYDADASGAGVVELSGNTVIVVVPGQFVGDPSGKLTGIGAASGEWSQFTVQYDTTDNSGEWTVGETCGKSGEEKLGTGGGSSSGSGSTGGGLLLIAAWVAWRRRTR